MAESTGGIAPMPSELRKLSRFSSHLLVLMLGCAMPLIALVIGIAIWTASEQRRNLILELQATSRALQLAVDRELQVSSAALQALSLSQAVDDALSAGPGGPAGALREFHAQARALVAHRPDALVSVLLLSPNGQQIINTLVPPGTPLLPPKSAASVAGESSEGGTFDPRSAVNSVVETGQPFIGDYSFARVAQRHIVPLLVPVLRDGAASGILLAGLRPESLGELLQAQRSKGVAAVVDRAGVIIGRSRDADRFVGTLATPEVRDFQESGATAISRRSLTADGTYAYGAFQRLQEVPWTLAYGTPQSAIDGPAWRAAATAAGAGGLALLLFALAGIWKGRRIGDELRSLAQDAAAVGQEHAVPLRDARIREVAEVRRALRSGMAALSDSEERFRLAVLGTGLATWEVDSESGRLLWSGGLPEMIGLAPDAANLTFTDWLDRVHPDDRADVEARWAHAQRNGELFHSVHRALHEDDGAARWIEAFGRAPAGEGGRRLLGMALDVTERKKAEERQHLLMSEVDHRSKNALAMVQAVVRLSRAETVHGFAKTVEGRVGALARAHDLLARDRWEGADLREVASLELAAFWRKGQVSAEGPLVRLAPEAVQPISMILHELVTNAAKHGALSVPGGYVRLTWLRDGQKGRLLLRWREQGGPPVEMPRKRGFGSDLIERIVEAQLDGTCTFEWERTGLACTLAILPRTTEQMARKGPFSQLRRAAASTA